VKQFQLQVLWLEDTIGFSVNQSISHIHLPLTSYYFWPLTDAWEQIKSELESKPWFCSSTQICLLNSIAEVINLWQLSRNLNPLERRNEYKKISSKDIFIIGLH